MGGFRSVFQLHAPPLFILLLLLLDCCLTLFGKHNLTIRLVLLVAPHDLVEILLCVLHIRHQVLAWIPRQPGTHLSDEEIVLGILATKNLRKHLCLLDRRERTTNLDTANIGLEMNRIVELLLEILLKLQKERLILLPNIRLANLLLVNLLKLVVIGKNIVDLDVVLLGNVRKEMLLTLHLPVIIQPLGKLLQLPEFLLLDDLLGGEEGDDAVLLSGNLRILIEVIYDGTICLVLWERDL